MTILIGDQGLENLKKWGYCAAMNNKTGEAELVRLEGVDIVNPERLDDE